MPSHLHPSCEDFVGRTIYLLPVHGWGWCRRDMRANVEMPRPFLMRVIRLTHHSGLLNGFMGRVETPEHPFNDLWGVTYLRGGDEWDLISSIPMNDILLGPNEPYLDEDPEFKEYWREKGKEPWYPLWGLDGSPQFGGQTYLAASREIGMAHFKNEFGGTSGLAL